MEYNIDIKKDKQSYVQNNNIEKESEDILLHGKI